MNFTRVLTTAFLALLSLTDLTHASNWSGWGGNFLNNRFAATNSDVTSSTIHSLAIKCRIDYHLGTSASPAIHNGIAYYPTHNGSFVALDYRTCSIKWQINVTQIIFDYKVPEDPNMTNAIAPTSRTSPQIDGNILYFGTQLNCLLVAVSLSNGEVLAIEQLSPHPAATVTMSPTSHGGKLYIGTSSLETTAILLVPGYKCCSFHGSMLALQFDHASRKFTVAWNVSTIADSALAAGWAGAAVWGSQPSVDTFRRQIYFGTGNTYQAPEAIYECQNATANLTAAHGDLTHDPCLPTNVWQESLIAIDIDSGSVNWIRQLHALDAWTAACGVEGTFLAYNEKMCPHVPGPDADFGMAPTLALSSHSKTPYGMDTIVVGQKNGFLWALSAATGQTFWVTVTGPGGAYGGLSWGIAVDDQRVYFTNINAPVPHAFNTPDGKAIVNSAYGSVNLTTGAILWEHAAPHNASAFNPPTVVGDLVLVGYTQRGGVTPGGGFPDSSSGMGGLLALNKSAGHVLKELELDHIFHGGVAVQDNYLLFGTGYNVLYYGNGSFYVAEVEAPKPKSSSTSAAVASPTLAGYGHPPP